MDWMIRISHREWASLGGLANSDLRRTLDEDGGYSYFKPGLEMPAAIRDWPERRCAAEARAVGDWIARFSAARVNAGMPGVERA